MNPVYRVSCEISCIAQLLKSLSASYPNPHLPVCHLASQLQKPDVERCNTEERFQDLPIDEWDVQSGCIGCSASLGALAMLRSSAYLG